MSIPVLIIGKSGSGKSASLRNFKREDMSLVNVLDKKLPFATEFNNEKAYLCSKNYNEILNFIKATPKQIIVIDDVGYIMTDKFVARSKETGYTKFTDLAKDFYDFINAIKEVEGNKRIYITMHEEKNDIGDVAPKTIGKMLDSQICIEGLFTIVLRAMFSNKNYIFRTKTDGLDVVKTPIGMFNADEMENDLKQVDDRICEYYNIKKEDKKELEPNKEENKNE